jgi:hypothetical protein
MSKINDIFEVSKQRKLTREDYLKFLQLNIDITKELSSELFEKQDKTIDLSDRVTMIEEEVRSLNQNFELYLKPELKEESNKIFVEYIRKFETIKYLYMKPLMDKTIYTIIFDNENYSDFLNKILDVELQIEDLYPMLKFDFHHFEEKDSKNINLIGYYLVYSSVN